MKWFQVFYIQIFLSEKLILPNSVWPLEYLFHTKMELSEFSTVINLLLHLQIMPVSVAHIRSWMLNFVSSRIITDFRKVPIINNMFCPFQLSILFLEVWEFLTALIFIMQMLETDPKDMDEQINTSICISC